jgi:hypothetical protein
MPGGLKLLLVAGTLNLNGNENRDSALNDGEDDAFGQAKMGRDVVGKEERCGQAERRIFDVGQIAEIRELGNDDDITRGSDSKT